MDASFHNDNSMREDESILQMSELGGQQQHEEKAPSSNSRTLRSQRSSFVVVEGDDVEDKFRVTLGQIIAEKQSFDGFGGLGRFLIHVIVAFAIAMLWTVDNGSASRNEITENLRAFDVPESDDSYDILDVVTPQDTATFVSAALYSQHPGARNQGF